MDWQAIVLSIRLAFWTSLILLVLGLPLAFWLARAPSILKTVVEAGVALPLVLPPTVLGFYLLRAMSPETPLGHIYQSLTGGGVLPFSFQGLLIGSVLYSLPFAVQPFVVGFVGIDQRLIEASWCLGVSKKKTFFRLIFPLCLPGIINGIILSFAHTLGEFGVVLMIGGNIEGVTRTVSVSIFDDFQSLNYQAASQTSAFLLLVSFIVLIFTSLLRKRAHQPWQVNSSYNLGKSFQRILKFKHI